MESDKIVSMKVRMLTEIGTSAALRCYWGKEDCPDCLGNGRAGYHNAENALGTTPTVGDWNFMGSPEDYADDRWPTKCDHCDATVPEDARKQVFRRRLYDSDSGIPERGDLFWAEHYGTEDGGCVFHDNCKGTHLFAVLPNGNQWDIDGRASNCTRKDDRLHRCWIREGTPPNVNVTKGKGADTCKAGAGSIASGGYHGFLRNGAFT